jgi:hypothetical protein
MRLQRVLLTSLLGLLCAAPALAEPAADAKAPAVAQPSPVQIDLCRLDYNTGAGGFGAFGLIGALAKSTGQLKIKFTNEDTREILIVRFGVDLEGKTASIRDVGKFGPGVTVDHGFKDYAGTTQFVFSRQPHPVCHVTYVKYADGTAWSLPDVPAVDMPSTPLAAPASGEAKHAAIEAKPAPNDVKEAPASPVSLPSPKP